MFLGNLSFRSAFLLHYKYLRNRYLSVPDVEMYWISNEQIYTCIPI